MSPSPTIHYDTQSNDITESFKSFINDEGLEKSEPVLEKELNDCDSRRLYLHFDGENKLHPEKSLIGTRITPSAIMISKASKTGTPEYHKDVSTPSQQSPTMSLGSKGSLDGWLLDKEIISRTYDKYQSFSPFKTPHCSAHVFRVDTSEKSKRNNDTRMSLSRRQILPPSLHNLDQFLPGEEESLRAQTSFTTRCLSPSRSMFIRQQKQPPLENVPSEIIVSRFPLLPAITKSQKSVRGDLINQKQRETDIAFSDSPGYEEEITACSIDDDDYEDVEEVLLNKEAFSAFDFFRSNNNNPQPVNNGAQTNNLQTNNLQTNNLQTNNLQTNNLQTNNLQTNNLQTNNLQTNNLQTNNDLNNLQADDLQIMNNDLKSDIKNEKLINSLNVSNGEIDNESNILSSDVPEDIKSIEDSKENVFDSHENSAGNDENILHTDENTRGTPKNTFTSKENIFDNKHVPEDLLEKSISGEFVDAELEDGVLVTCAEFESSEARGDSLKASISCNDDITPNSCIAAGDLVNNSNIEINLISPESNSDRNLAEIKTESANQTSNKPTEFCEETSTTPHQICDIDNDGIHSDSAITGNSGIVEINCTVDETDNIESSGITEDNGVIDEPGIIENIDVVKDTEMMTKTKMADPVKSKISSNKKVSNIDGETKSDVSNIGLQDSTPSVMTDIFNNQLVEKSSLFLTPAYAEDFTEGLDLNHELEDEIMRAMDGLEEFILDDYEVENN